MDIKEKTTALLGGAKSFLTKRSKIQNVLNNGDKADILIALIPMALFGCIVFELRALSVLVCSVLLNVALDFLWALIFKKSKKFDLQSVIFGLLAGLTLSSLLNVWIMIAVNVVAFALRKTIFKGEKIGFFTPWLISKALFAIVLFGAFSVYAAPFVRVAQVPMPIDANFITISFVHSAKHLFFGIHSGNIGEVSELLIILGGVYLIFRKLINPIIPVSFILTSVILSAASGDSLDVVLLGGGLFFAAFFLTFDYNFVDSPLYKKVLYGIVCGLLTFVIRMLIKTEGAYFVVPVVNLIFVIFTRRNLKKIVKFVKAPDFGKLFKKVKDRLSV